MTPRVTIAASLLLLICTFVAGFFVSKGIYSGRVVTKTKIEYRDRIVEKAAETAVDKVKITEKRFTKPDGQVKEIKQIVSYNKQSIEQISEHEKTQTAEATQVQRNVLPDYRISVHAPAKDFKDVRLGVGRRLLGSIWLEAGVSPKNLEATVGLGVEF